MAVSGRGAGAGSVARWLAKRVGPAGRVIATDLDTTLLQRLRLANLQVERHDLVRDRLHEREFDLAHTRLVLMHLPQREQVLSNLCDAVKPGGWIVLEEFDSLSLVRDSSLQHRETPLKTAAAFRQHMASQGVDLGYGRLLTAELLRHGFVNIKSEGRVSMWQGGSAGSRFMRSTYEELREQILRTGMVSEQDYDRDLAQLGDTSFLCISPVMWTVSGRRPTGS
jgi:SAM-dependent methyltransferase